MALTQLLRCDGKSSATLLNFIVIMLAHPDVQKKAHEELDRVIGRERMSDLYDRESLPYVDAICKEVLRIRPILPFGVPHASIK